MRYVFAKGFSNENGGYDWSTVRKIIHKKIEKDAIRREVLLEQQQMRKEVVMTTTSEDVVM